MIGRRALAAALLALLVAAAGLAQEAVRAVPRPLDEGGRAEPLPEELRGVGIEARLDAVVPADLAFVDESGQAVTLGRYLGGERPVLLALVYYQCPMLCNLLLNGVVDALREIDLTPGVDFELVAVSINPRETPTLARLKKQGYVAEYGRPESAPGWHLLTGREAEIRTLADTVGFHYRYVEDRGEYAHGAGIFLLTPDGRLSRFLSGVQFPPRTLRLSLLEASEGRIGSPLDQFVLFCFHYDETKGRYAPAAMNLMRVGGALTAFVLGGVLLGFWRREARRRKRPEA